MSPQMQSRRDVTFSDGSTAQANARRDVPGGTFTPWTCFVTLTATLTVSPLTETLVTWDVAALDPHSMWDAGNPTVITIPASDLWIVSARQTVQNQAVFGEEFACTIRINGVDVNCRETKVYPIDTAADAVYNTPVDLFDLTAGDEVSLYLYHTGATDVDYLSGLFPWLTVQRVS